MNLIKIGTDYGGWTIPDEILDSSSICYSVGAGEDISFDVGLIEKYDCDVFCFDPTPRAINHVTSIINGNLVFNNSGFSIKYEIRREKLSKLKLNAFGIFNRDCKMKFYSPENPSHVSHSIGNIQKTKTYFVAECKKTKTVMRTLGHDNIHLLKLDIEGVEIDVIKDMIKDRISPKILCVEFDSVLIEHSYVKGTRMLYELVEYGYEIIFEKAWNVTFIFNLERSKLKNYIKILKITAVQAVKDSLRKITRELI